MPVCTQSDLMNLPPLTGDISPLYIRKMDMADEADIRAWLDVHNDAFERNCEPDVYRRCMVEHPDLIVRSTYFLMHGDDAVGATSIGVFRRNPEVGVGHYLQLQKRYHGRGLGKYLFLFRCHKIKEFGVAACENITDISRKKALFIHFDCGFQPKLRSDHWNSPDRVSPLVRAFGNYQLAKLYREWKKRQRFGARGVS